MNTTTKATNHKFIIQPHFRLQEWIAEEKGYFKDEGLDYIFREDSEIDRRQGARQGATKSAPFSPSRKGRKSDVSCACHWTVNVAAASGPWPAQPRCLFGGAVGHFCRAGFADQDAGRSRRRADLGRLPVRQPLRVDPGAGNLHAEGADQPVVQRRHAVQAHGAAARRQDPGGNPVLRALLPRRAARLPQDHGQHLHDRHHDPRRSRSGRPAQILHAR